MTQEFKGPTGDVAGRDVIKHVHGGGRPLSKVERRGLNNLVKLLETKYGQPGQQTWSALHNKLGVDGIEMICHDQLMPAEAILTLQIENAELRRKESQHLDDRVSRDTLKQSADAMAILSGKNAQLSAALQSYQQACNDLNARLNRQSAELRDALSRAQQAEALAKARTVVGYCTQCQAANSAVASSRRKLLVSTAVAVMASAAAAYFAAGDQAWAEPETTVPPSAPTCQFDGHPYSPGSTITRQGDALRCDVTKDKPGPHWSKVDDDKPKKPAIKRRPKPKPAPTVDEAEQPGPGERLF